LNLTHVRSFLAVLDGGGFRAAARQLEVSPSTLVDHINQLEAELTAPLLVRKRGGFAPTSQGLAFLPLARALVATAERAGEVVAGCPLRIAAASNVGIYLLQSILASFKQAEAYPTELWIGRNPDVAERIGGGRADVEAHGANSRRMAWVCWPRAGTAAGASSRRARPRRWRRAKRVSPGGTCATCWERK